MKARDALVDTLGVRPVRDTVAVAFSQADRIVDALLAQTPEGEGVYIAPDGTLMRVRPHYLYESLYVFVPIEEATDE